MFILYEVSEKTALITIDRPNSLNALNTEVLRELSATLKKAEEDQAVRVAIITGSGDRAFVAGADVAELATLSPAQGADFSRFGQGVFSQIENMSKPVIAAVNGHALGGGCELALACDIRLASEKATFGLPELGLGVIPGFAGTQRLPRLVGPGWALHLILTAQRIDAGQALEIGLVTGVVASGELMARARDLAAQMAKLSPGAIRAAKEAVYRGQNLDMPTACAYEASLHGLCYADPDHSVRMETFLNKGK